MVEAPRAEPAAGTASDTSEDGSGTPEAVKTDSPETPVPPVQETTVDTAASGGAVAAETQAPRADPPKSADDSAPTPEKAPDGSPVTMDAIEEEMARLLSEISGTRK